MKRSTRSNYVWRVAVELGRGQLLGKLLNKQVRVTGSMLVLLLFLAALSGLSGHDSLLFASAILIAGLPLTLFLAITKILARTAADAAEEGIELLSFSAFLSLAGIQYLFTKSAKDLSGEIYHSLVTSGVRVACISDEAPAKTSIKLATVSGKQFTKLANNQIIALLDSGATLFYQLSAEQRLHLVLVAQTYGMVGYLGDDHTDEPAVEQAEVGMSHQTGYPAADMIIAGDSRQLLTMLRLARRSVDTLNKVIRSAIVVAITELLIITLGLIGLLWQHILPAFGVRQLVIINLIAVTMPLVHLKDDHNRVKARLTIEHLDVYAISGLIGFSSIIGLLGYLNYLYFYTRINLSPNYLDPSLPLYHQATTITFLTIVACCFIHILFERSASKTKFWTSYLLQNTKLLVAYGFVILLTIAVMYVPLFQTLLGTSALSFLDWLTTLGCAVFYGFFRLAQRQTRRHTRKAILRDHHPDHLRRHLSV